MWRQPVPEKRDKIPINYFTSWGANVLLEPSGGAKERGGTEGGRKGKGEGKREREGGFLWDTPWPGEHNWASPSQLPGLPLTQGFPALSGFLTGTQSPLPRSPFHRWRAERSLCKTWIPRNGGQAGLHCLKHKLGFCLFVHFLGCFPSQPE